MKLKLMIAAILLSMALPAASADRAIIEDAYEVALNQVRLPRNENGTIGFKKCSSCDFVTKRVSRNTQYQLNGKAISLREFREAVSAAASQSDQAATVFHHIKSDRVTKISVYLRGKNDE